MTRITKAPLPSGYLPEIDVSEIIGPDTANWFQNISGILNWIVDIGCIDINNSVAQLSTFLVNTRDGNLRYPLHVFY